MPDLSNLEAQLGLVVDSPAWHAWWQAAGHVPVWKQSYRGVRLVDGKRGFVCGGLFGVVDRDSVVCDLMVDLTKSAVTASACGVDAGARRADVRGTLGGPTSSTEAWPKVRLPASDLWERGDARRRVRLRVDYDDEDRASSVTVWWPEEPIEVPVPDAPKRKSSTTVKRSSTAAEQSKTTQRQKSRT